MKPTRSRTGCATCRKRHQKCDESKPSCWNCRMRGVECGGYGIRLTDFVSQSGVDGRMVSKARRGTLTRHGSRLEKTQRDHRPTLAGESTVTCPVDLPPTQGTSNSTSVSSNCHSLQGESLLARSPVHGNADLDISQESTEIDVCDPQGFQAGTLRGHELLVLEAMLEPNVGWNLDIPRDQEDWAEVSCYPGNSVTTVLQNLDSSSQSIGKSLWFNDDSSFTSGMFGLVRMDEPTDTFSNEAISDLRSSSGNEQCPEKDSLAVDQMMHFSLKDPVLRAPPSDPFDQYLFSHYINTLSLRLYPVKPDQNPYRMVYGSLAVESKPLLSVILFASALHLSKLGQLPKFAVKPYRMAMRDSFRDALRTENEALGLGATVLLSIVFDVIGTGLDIWSSKIVGCRRLLEQSLSRSNRKPSPAMRCVVLQYNWTAAMGRVILRGSQSPAFLDEMKRIVPESSSFGPQPQDIEMAAYQSHWWNNLPDYRMHLLLQDATDLCLQVDQLKSTPEHVESLLQLMPRVSELISKIQNWQPDISAVAPEYIDSVQHFNCIWRQGILCFVYHDIYSLGSSHELIQACVEASLEPFRRLSWLQACLFPLFMVAVHARTDQARECFEHGLMDMHTSLAFQTPLSVVLILKNIWERLDSDLGGAARWRDIIKEMGMELNILL
ncbi:fungal-specific transcription factor domain-containing protein [Leptodontidium sp. MPI-SDFR-AT-0119]|nr:fungal-specific transcription factor domain-containing protein [Leptodontidium sp. MPI-SDFR-AT-0119]